MLHRTGLGKENQHPGGKTGTRMVEESEGKAKCRHQVEEKQGGCGEEREWTRQQRPRESPGKEEV